MPQHWLQRLTCELIVWLPLILNMRYPLSIIPACIRLRL